MLAFVFFALSILLVLFAFITDNPLCAVAALLFLIIAICIDENTEKKRTVENVTSIQGDTIYIVSNADTIMIYNVTYTK